MTARDVGVEEELMLVEQARQQRPRPDLITALVQGTIGGRPLPQHEIDAMFLLLVVAGNETNLPGSRRR